jgi:ABC-type dipeptide/oligopeptide/nickel transport system permease subunit
MVRLPRDISPGTAARRSLLADSLIAIALAILALQLAAGVGVVGFFALLVLLVLLSWIGIEAAIRGLARRRRARGADGQA